jgi:hypothetical protein
MCCGSFPFLALCRLKPNASLNPEKVLVETKKGMHTILRQGRKEKKE